MCLSEDLCDVRQRDHLRHLPHGNSKDNKKGKNGMVLSNELALGRVRTEYWGKVGWFVTLQPLMKARALLVEERSLADNT